MLIWCAKKVVRTYGTVLLDNIGASELAAGGRGADVTRDETDTGTRKRETGVAPRLHRGGRRYPIELEVDGEARAEVILAADLWFATLFLRGS